MRWMKIDKSPVVFGLCATLALGGVALASSPVEAQSRGGARVMTCHGMIDGVPDREATTYTLRGNTLYGNGGQVLSTPAMRMIGSSIDNGRRQRSWAKHVPTRDGVLRQVYWEDRSGRPKLAFSERYDFARQRIVDSNDGTDSCNHNYYRRR